MTVTIDRDTRRRELFTTARLLEHDADADADAGRTVDVVAVPFGQTLEMFGGMFSEEVSADAAVTLRDPQSLPMFWRHDEVIGAWDVTALRREADHLGASGRVSDTSLGRDVQTLLADRAVAGASVGFNVLKSHSERRDTGNVEVIDALELFEISLTPLPAFTDARVQRVREHEPKGQTMPDTATATLPDDVRELPARVTEVETTAAQTREALAQLAAAVDAANDAGAGAHPLREFETAGDYARALYAGDARLFALVDQTTTDNPGVIPPGWVTDIAGMVDRPQRVMTAFGGRQSLPAAGMTVEWPYVDPALDLDAVVAEQTAEKTEVNSVAVKLLKGSSDIVTYAAGSDVSYQLIMRSAPAYLTAYLALLANAFGRTEEVAFAAAVAAAATGSVSGGASVLTDKAACAAALFDASDVVDDATGSPAAFAIASADVFRTLGGLFSDTPPAYNTQNTPGVGQASTLRVEVSGLPVIKGRGLAAGTLKVSNDQAATPRGTGAMFASAEDVAKLGRNQAVWGLSASTIEYPAGIVTVPTA